MFRYQVALLSVKWARRIVIVLAAIVELTRMIVRLRGFVFCDICMDIFAVSIRILRKMQHGVMSPMVCSTAVKGFTVVAEMTRPKTIST